MTLCVCILCLRGKRTLYIEGCFALVKGLDLTDCSYKEFTVDVLRLYDLAFERGLIFG